MKRLVRSLQAVRNCLLCVAALSCTDVLEDDVAKVTAIAVANDGLVELTLQTYEPSAPVITRTVILSATTTANLAEQLGRETVPVHLRMEHVSLCGSSAVSADCLPRLELGAQMDGIYLEPAVDPDLEPTDSSVRSGDIPEENIDPECDGHGELVDGRCECDPGYESSAGRPRSCEPTQFFRRGDRDDH